MTAMPGGEYTSALAVRRRPLVARPRLRFVRTASATGLPVSRRRWEGRRDERARIAPDPRRDAVGALVGVRPTSRTGRARAAVPRGAGPGGARGGPRGRALAARTVAAPRLGVC